jgi:hypothetical protein
VWHGSVIWGVLEQLLIKARRSFHNSSTVALSKHVVSLLQPLIWDPNGGNGLVGRYIRCSMIYAAILALFQSSVLEQAVANSSIANGSSQSQHTESQLDMQYIRAARVYPSAVLVWKLLSNRPYTSFGLLLLSALLIEFTIHLFRSGITPLELSLRLGLGFLGMLSIYKKVPRGAVSNSRTVQILIWILVPPAVSRNDA